MSASDSEPQVTADLVTSDADAHIKWLKDVFNTEIGEIYRKDNKDDGLIMHAVVKFPNGGVVYFGDARTGPCSFGTPGGFITNIVMEDPDAVWEKAINNKAEVAIKLEKQFWGGYYGVFKDPFGYCWSVCKPRV